MHLLYRSYGDMNPSAFETEFKCFYFNFIVYKKSKTDYRKSLCFSLELPTEVRIILNLSQDNRLSKVNLLILYPLFFYLSFFFCNGMKLCIWHKSWLVRAKYAAGLSAALRQIHYKSCDLKIGATWFFCNFFWNMSNVKQNFQWGMSCMVITILVCKSPEHQAYRLAHRP